MKAPILELKPPQEDIKYAFLGPIETFLVVILVQRESRRTIATYTSNA